MYYIPAQSILLSHSPEGLGVKCRFFQWTFHSLSVVNVTLNKQHISGFKEGSLKLN